MVHTNMTIPPLQQFSNGTSRCERVLAPLNPRIRHVFPGRRRRNGSTFASPPLSNLLVVDAHGAGASRTEKACSTRGDVGCTVADEQLRARA